MEELNQSEWYKIKYDCSLSKLRLIKTDDSFSSKEVESMKEEYVRMLFLLYNNDINMNIWKKFYYRYLVLKNKPLNTYLYILLNLLENALLDVKVQFLNDDEEYYYNKGIRKIKKDTISIHLKELTLK